MPYFGFYFGHPVHDFFFGMCSYIFNFFFFLNRIINIFRLQDLLLMKGQEFFFLYLQSDLILKEKREREREKERERKKKNNLPQIK